MRSCQEAIEIKCGTHGQYRRDAGGQLAAHAVEDRRRAKFGGQIGERAEEAFLVDDDMPDTLALQLGPSRRRADEEDGRYASPTSQRVPGSRIPGRDRSPSASQIPDKSKKTIRSGRALGRSV
jgi:hypothetical protein